MGEDYLLNSVMRSLGGAWRSLRLYPAESPMTAQAAERACETIEEYVQAEPSLKLDVVRGGFILRGLDGLLNSPGVPDFAAALASHGIGELHFVAPPLAEEVITLLSTAQLQPRELADRGGMLAVLRGSNVGSITVVPLVLTKVETPPEIPEEDAEKFLAELAADAGRLAVWLRSLLASDDEGLADGIRTLASAAVDVRVFGRTMAAAFLELDTTDKDRLLEASITLEAVHDVMTEMLANLSDVELTAAMRGGRYGSNLMSLSFALSMLPVGTRFRELERETAEALRAADVREPDVGFFERMIALRRFGLPDPPLAESQPVFRSMLGAIPLGPEQIATVQRDVVPRRHLGAAGIAALTRLLEVSDGFEAFCRVLNALGRAVPDLLEDGQMDLAMSLVRAMADGSLATGKPWPELDAGTARSMEEACGVRSMLALLAAGQSDGHATEYARELVTSGGPNADRSLAGAAIQSEVDNSLEFAEFVLGRRLPELLVPEAQFAEARHAAKLAEIFARDGGPRSIQALSQLIARPEDRVRSEAARGIAAVGGPAVTALMPALLRDQSSAVASTAAYTLIRNRGDEAVDMLAARLVELEEEKDLSVAREIIGFFITSSSSVAETALRQVAEKRSFLRRGQHPEIRQMAREALEVREKRKGA